MSPTSAQVDARIAECKGRWAAVGGTRDELTMLARERRDRQIAQMTADNKGTKEIADHFGLSAHAVRRIVGEWAMITDGLPPITTTPEAAGPSWETQPAARTDATPSSPAVSSRIVGQAHESRRTAYAAD
ncbi:hypothetical protein [Amycolatopsis sp. NPDC004079]|uniref:hypothetical protein n=1 Tax=Amycolatopsis sp. NPDC004079 TaxID=3154549 RepID=UPI0033BA1B5A